MLNDTQKSNNHNRIYIIIAVVLLCATVYFTVRGCGNDTGTAELYQRTDAAVERIEAEHTDAGRELDAASGQLDTAGATLQRADELIDRSQERASQNAASIADCRQLVKRCQEIVADSERIYAEAEEANRSGTASGG